MGIVTQLKVCKDCKVEKEISSGFYVHSEMSDGYLNKCKECVKSRLKKYRFENDSVREYDRNRYYNDPNRIAYSKAQGKKWREENRDRHNELTRNSILRNPEKRKARTMVRTSLKNGRIIKQPCTVCGLEKSEAHHEDYSKPLEIIWLCRKHHGEKHRLSPSDLPK